MRMPAKDDSNTGREEIHSSTISCCCSAGGLITLGRAASAPSTRAPSPTAPSSPSSAPCWSVNPPSCLLISSTLNRRMKTINLNSGMNDCSGCRTLTWTWSSGARSRSWRASSTRALFASTGTWSAARSASSSSSTSPTAPSGSASTVSYHLPLLLCFQVHLSPRQQPTKP